MALDVHAYRGGRMGRLLTGSGNAPEVSWIRMEILSWIRSFLF